MLVCHCRTVSDREVRAAIECGARTVGAVARQCGAGGACGGCRFALRDLLERCAGDTPVPSCHDDALTVTAAA
jgi:bacterioferritin-associated ferredoxin